jgi:hypothetical protein
LHFSISLNWTDTNPDAAKKLQFQRPNGTTFRVTAPEINAASLPLALLFRGLGNRYDTLQSMVTASP